MADQNFQSTAQNFLDIFDITNNLVILKDGTVSFILSVSAMNFGLLAEEEQDAVIYTYAALLNSLNYPVQIVIRSQTKDATSYLNLLKEQEQKASSQNKSERIARYRHFVGRLIKERNVLDKKFYVVVPANALELGILPAESLIPGKSKDIDLSKIERSVILEKAQSVLEPKRDHLISQFARLGLYTRQLSTEEIIRIFYNNYNPEANEGQQIADTSQYTTPLVRANFMNTTTPQQEQQQNTQVQQPEPVQGQAGRAQAAQTQAQQPDTTQAAQPAQANQPAQADQSVQPSPPTQSNQSQLTQPQAQPQSGVNSNMPSAQQIPAEQNHPLTQSQQNQSVQTSPQPQQSVQNKTESGFKEEITGLNPAQKAQSQQPAQPENPDQPEQPDQSIQTDQAKPVPTKKDQNLPDIENIKQTQQSADNQPSKSNQQPKQESKKEVTTGEDPQSAINQTLEEISVFDQNGQNNSSQAQNKQQTKDDNLPPIAEI